MTKRTKNLLWLLATALYLILLTYLFDQSNQREFARDTLYYEAGQRNGARSKR